MTSILFWKTKIIEIEIEFNLQKEKFLNYRWDLPNACYSEIQNGDPAGNRCSLGFIWL